VEAIEYISPGIEIHNCKFWYGNPCLNAMIEVKGAHRHGLATNERMKEHDE
jgi:hypothetical protein